MRCKLLVLGLMFLAPMARAQERTAYLSGKLLQMDSAQCESHSKAADSSTADSGQKDGQKKEQAKICAEYVLQADEVIYRIRPRNAKHPVLLPVGEWAQFRMQSDKMQLRVQALDNKEREYIVISMRPRGDSSADSIRVRLNHLQ
jgi:hypothetical protein